MNAKNVKISKPLFSLPSTALTACVLVARNGRFLSIVFDISLVEFYETSNFNCFYSVLNVKERKGKRMKYFCFCLLFLPTRLCYACVSV